MILHGYWRSSASYRVRIALNLKGVPFEQRPVHLVKDGGQQHSEAYRKLNPSALVPTLIDEEQDLILTQSLAIIEYLDRRCESPKLIPEDPLQQCRVRALCYDICQDIQPITNLRVIQHLTTTFSADQDAAKAWQQEWMARAFAGIEKQLSMSAGDYCFGFEVSMADICLVPQVYNAHRYNLDMSPFPNIARINDHCLKQAPFIAAVPENQPDAS